MLLKPYIELRWGLFRKNATKEDITIIQKAVTLLYEAVALRETTMNKSPLWRLRHKGSIQKLDGIIMSLDSRIRQSIDNIVIAPSRYLPEVMRPTYLLGDTE
ncbi:MAG TPA: hypothetical protein PLY16_01540 [Candidatus Saccharibacteria bacterium]|nr:hypothetical protein [Candidatus Saccharibacteria bacterium]